MKANKIFAIALAALAFVACKPTNDDEVTALELSKTSATIAVGETLTLTANVTVDAWTSNKPEVATVTDGVVLGVSEGTAIISATAGSDTKTCVVKVEADNGGGNQGGTAEVKGSKFWPIVMDGETLEANQSKMVASFQPNDVDQFLYVWDETYVAGNGDGLNSMGKAKFTALVVNAGWAGCGYCLTAAGTGWQAAEALRQEILADPDNYFLHLAIKSTDQASHCFYFMGNEGTKFGLGANKVYDAPETTDFTRDGSWHSFDIPMSKYANALATPVAAGVNVFVALTEGVMGAQLNLDAVYFYKK